MKSVNKASMISADPKQKNYKRKVVTKGTEYNFKDKLCGLCGKLINYKNWSKHWGNKIHSDWLSTEWTKEEEEEQKREKKKKFKLDPGEKPIFPHS